MPLSPPPGAPTAWVLCWARPAGEAGACPVTAPSQARPPQTPRHSPRFSGPSGCLGPSILALATGCPSHSPGFSSLLTTELPGTSRGPDPSQAASQWRGGGRSHQHHGEHGRRTSAHTATRRECCRLRRTQNRPSLPAPPPLARVPGCLAQAEWTERELSQASTLASKCPRQPRVPGVPGCRGSPCHQNHPSRCCPTLPVHTQFPGPQACCPERPPTREPWVCGSGSKAGDQPCPPPVHEGSYATCPGTELCPRCRVGQRRCAGLGWPRPSEHRASSWESKLS